MKKRNNKNNDLLNGPNESLGRFNKVAVALSGGVDSAVSALILKNKGFDVTAIFMKLNKFSKEDKARKLAKEIGVPFKVIDLRKEFKEKIIDYFIEEYKLGNTPNPCVICNKEIKFGLFLKEANADFIATGHYAKTKDGCLYKAKDPKKDQSYFLWKLNSKTLKKVIFPLSNFTKEEIKEIAKNNNLSIVGGESQEVCFISEANNEFLKKYIKEKKGDIINKKGEVIGKHSGVWFYTIGQRRGIGLSGGPYWVIDKDVKRNKLIVSLKEKDLFSKEVFLKNANWIKKVDFPIRVKAKIRYGHKGDFGVLNNNKFTFDKPQKAITRGQSIVFYNKSEVIGGGIIK
ncbi:MAG: tRNA-specific 2-thiouridylase MnmA [Parcubacteria bacterium 33_209]|nr:MAG: tRNA-specific 2-thiouridylase MnmA [Parcubacteria bacterium 33_209]